MSTIVGHALAGVAVSAVASSGIPAGSKRAVAVAAVLAAVLPDVDVVLLLVWPEGAEHRGLSHSLIAAAAIAAAVAAGSRRKTRLSFKPGFLLLFAAALSHLLLDWAMGTGPPIRPFAPFSEVGYLAPARLVPTAYYARTASGYATPLFWFGNAFALALEVLVLVPAIIGLRRHSSRRLRILAGATSATAFAVTLLLFN